MSHYRFHGEKQKYRIVNYLELINERTNKWRIENKGKDKATYKYIPKKNEVDRNVILKERRGGKEIGWYLNEFKCLSLTKEMKERKKNQAHILRNDIFEANN